MWKIICLSVLLYVTCLSNIADGRRLGRLGQKVSMLQKVQNNIHALLSENIGQEFTVNGKIYLIESVLGVVPKGVPAHKYNRYWKNAKFLNSALLQLKFDVKKVVDVDNVTPAPKDTYVFSDDTYVAEGGFGYVYRATKYNTDGSKDTKEYVIKQVNLIADAEKECAEYNAIPESAYFIRCYGTASGGTFGYAVLDDAGEDLDDYMGGGGDMSEVHRKAIIGTMLRAIKIFFTVSKSHRDIKPGNICVKGDKIFLIDFGLVYNWGTDTTVANIDTLARKGSHGTPYYNWPALDVLVAYKDSDKVSSSTKQAYVDRVKPLMYLVDVGGIFTTHVQLITQFRYDQVAAVYPFYEAEVARADTAGDFWARNGVSTDEKALMLAMQDPSKTIDQLLAMTWVAS